MSVQPGGLTEVTRVLVVDDQRAFAESLEHVIRSHDDLECLGSAGSGEDAIAMAAEHRPDVVIMDVALPGMDGIDATRRIVERAPDVAVVVLTGVPDASVLARAASAGARAFLLKDASVNEIVDAVRSVERTTSMDIDPSTVEQILEGADQNGSALTQRELEVLGLLAQGRQPKQIAYDLGITVNTCRGYVKNILAKLETHSALEAVLEANRRGLITLPAGD